MAGYYPKGKLNDDDEGALVVALSVQKKTLIIDFGKKITWIGLGRDEALNLAKSIMDHVEKLL